MPLRGRWVIDFAQLSFASKSHKNNFTHSTLALSHCLKTRHIKRTGRFEKFYQQNAHRDDARKRTRGMNRKTSWKNYQVTFLTSRPELSSTLEKKLFPLISGNENAILRKIRWPIDGEIHVFDVTFSFPNKKPSRDIW